MGGAFLSCCRRGARALGRTTRRPSRRRSVAGTLNRHHLRALEELLVSRAHDLGARLDSGEHLDHVRHARAEGERRPRHHAVILHAVDEGLAPLDEDRLGRNDQRVVPLHEHGRDVGRHARTKPPARIDDASDDARAPGRLIEHRLDHVDLALELLAWERNRGDGDIGSTDELREVALRRGEVDPHLIDLREVGDHLARADERTRAHVARADHAAPRRADRRLVQTGARDRVVRLRHLERGAGVVEVLRRTGALRDDRLHAFVARLRLIAHRFGSRDLGRELDVVDLREKLALADRATFSERQALHQAVDLGDDIDRLPRVDGADRLEALDHRSRVHDHDLDRHRGHLEAAATRAAARTAFRLLAAARADDRAEQRSEQNEPWRGAAQ